jgi:two-component system sensor histidine kinase GlrK
VRIVSKISFRQLLFAAFILIAMVPTVVSVQALLTLDQLATLGRSFAAEAIMLTEQSQRLSERTRTMERSARQFMVRDEAVFRDRYLVAWKDAGVALKALTLAMPGLAPGLASEWTRHSAACWSALKVGKQAGLDGHPLVIQALARLPAINALLALESKREIERRNDDLHAELERQRHLLMASVVAALVLAALLAAGFGFWLARPLQRIETAIERLGENRYDQVVMVGGPADTRKLGLQLNWLRRRLADLDEGKERFLLQISHQMRTPLAALREGVSLLEDEVAGPLNGGQREIGHILRQNTVALQAQIEDLLRYNAAAFHAQHLQRKQVDLVALVQRVANEQRLQCQGRDLDVSVSGPSVSALVDADKLGLALANMLSNAVRFSLRGGSIALIVGSGPDGQSIDCIDQGRGVASEDAARIFEPFYQGRRQPADAGKTKGNGIGLSIAREYVIAHHGSIALLASDVGAHFRIELPNAP